MSDGWRCGVSTMRGVSLLLGATAITRFNGLRQRSPMSRLPSPSAYRSAAVLRDLAYAAVLTLIAFLKFCLGDER